MTPLHIASLGAIYSLFEIRILRFLRTIPFYWMIHWTQKCHQTRNVCWYIL